MLFLLQSYRRKTTVQPPYGGGFNPPATQNKIFITFTPSYEDEEALLLWLTLENLI